MSPLLQLMRSPVHGESGRQRLRLFPKFGPVLDSVQELVQPERRMAKQ